MPSSPTATVRESEEKGQIRLDDHTSGEQVLEFMPGLDALPVASDYWRQLCISSDCRKLLPLTLLGKIIACVS